MAEQVCVAQACQCAATESQESQKAQNIAESFAKLSSLNASVAAVELWQQVGFAASSFYSFTRPGTKHGFEHRFASERHVRACVVAVIFFEGRVNLHLGHVCLRSSSLEVVEIASRNMRNDLEFMHAAYQNESLVSKSLMF